MTRDDRRLLVVYLALLTLLAVTVASSQLDLDAFNSIVNLGVAVAKTTLIFWFFMELREASGLVRLFAVGGICWLLILIVIGIADWLTRSPPAM